MSDHPVRARVTHARTVLVAILSIAAGLLAVVTSPAPAAHAGDGSYWSNYVGLAKPYKLLGQALNPGQALNLTAIGVGGIPRSGTTAVVLTVAAASTSGKGTIQVNGQTDPSTAGTNYSPEYINALGIQADEDHSFSTTVTIPVSDTRTSNHVRVSEVSNVSSVNVRVMVAGYYTRSATGGGFVPMRNVPLFDTRQPATPGGTAVSIAAGGTLTKTLTGGVVPSGVSALHMTLAAVGATASGTIVAAPGTDTTGIEHSLAFWAGSNAVSGQVSVPVGADGKVSFRNTSAKPVHLVAIATGYSTATPTTGYGWQPTVSGGYTQHLKTIPASGSVEVEVGGRNIPIASVGVTAHVDLYNTTGSGYLRSSPSDQDPGASLLNFSDMTADRHRSMGAILTLGDDGAITLENVSSKPVSVIITVTGYFMAPPYFVPAGGSSAISVAHTSNGPCYGYLDPDTQRIKAGCSASYGDTQSAFGFLSPQGETFAGPVSLVARPGGRFVVTALHYYDGEVWTWELAHTTGLLNPEHVRTYRSMKVAPVSATMPDGKPMAFTADADGRLWALNINVTGANQPTWRPLDLIASRVTNLSALATPDGIRLAARDGNGAPWVGLYTGSGNTAGMQNIAVGDVTQIVGAPAIAQAPNAAPVVVVRQGNKLWSARLTISGSTSHGWTPVSTYDFTNGGDVALTGSPSLAYDPLDRTLRTLFWSDAVGTGQVYKVSESGPGTGDFSQGSVSSETTTAGVSTDLTTWDYRQVDPLENDRWSYVYLDAAGGRQGVTATVNG